MFRDISYRVKSKGKELISLVYPPVEDEPPLKPNTPDTELDGTDKVDLLKIDSLDGSAKYWVGKDYVNFIVKDFTKLDSPFDDFIDRVSIFTPFKNWKKKIKKL